MIQGRAEQAFQAEFGIASAGQFSAPGRVNLIGEHTDYNEGFVLPFAIPNRTAVSVRLRSDRLIRVHSVDLAETQEISIDELVPDALSGWSAYPLGVAWALLEGCSQADTVQGVDIAVA